MTHTFLVCDRAYNVLATTDTEHEADRIVAREPILQRQVVEVATADIATLARIAQADDPRLARVGEGILGAGTHPAQPYLSAMLGMHGVGNGRHDLGDVRYGYDDGTDIVRRFLDNFGQWRGDTARTVKARLREIVAAAR